MHYFINLNNFKLYLPLNITNMITQITSKKDVVTFAKNLIAEGVSFHPDDNFSDIVNNKTNKPTYTKSDAAKRNNLMNQSFEICEKEGVDIYELMLETTLTETGLDKLIPLPSDLN